MKKINIGMVNFLVSKKLHESYINKNLIEESKETVNTLLETINSSPILNLEFKVFNNLENKYIENELAATRYIDNNIKLFEVYTLKEIDVEHKKLKSFINEDVETIDSKIDLYIAINNLITESLKDNVDVDVNVIEESYNIVLEHIKNNKPKMIEESTEIISEQVLEMAIDKFNKKYESLEENDRNLFTELIKADENKKQLMLENYKKENLEIFRNLEILGKADDATIKERINTGIKKINEMKYNNITIIDDIINLHELKKSISVVL